MKRYIKVALAGNPNVGKTALMNALAGTSEKIGNWPGVTVQKKTGMYNFRGFEIELIDLPGIYSLTSYTLEELVTRTFLLKGKYDVVLNVVDSTLLERNLYLTLELLEMGVKPVIVLNKVDELRDENYSIDIKALETILKLPAVSISATRRKGLEELSETILRADAGDVELEGIVPIYSEDVENAISLLLLRMEGTYIPYNRRWFAVKLLENDPEIVEEAKKLLHSRDAVFKEIEVIKSMFEEKYHCELSSYIAKERFKLASQIAKKVIKNIAEVSRKRFSDDIDRFVTNPLFGIPIFFFVMWLVFKFTFDGSTPISNWIDSLFSDTLPGLISKYPHIGLSLVNDGIIAGVGAVLVFLPVLIILYFLMAILEDTGYMARAAALWDNFMRLFGLSGASVIPMILGFGCNVPAIYATRAMKSSKERLITMLIIPWMSCGARLTIYSIFVAAFFKGHKAFVVSSLYILGVVLAILLALILSKFFKQEAEGEFFIELPPYKLPSWNVVVNQTWIEVREFLYKAGTVIFAVSVFVWALASLPTGVEYASANSLIGSVGKLLVPVFHPLGINDWKPVVALIFGALAKEVVVGTLGTLYGGETNIVHSLSNVFTPASALAYVVFTLLYIPCVATIASIKQESGSWKWPIFAIVLELITAWAAAFIVYNVAKLLF